jgi:hypothetical protein
MTIFAGETEFTTPRPFEAKSARVKLSFTVDAGQDAAVVGAETGALARTLAYQMIGETAAVTLTETTKRRGPTSQAAPVVQATVTSAVVTDQSTGLSAPTAASPSEGAHDPFGAPGAPASSAPGSVPASATVSNEAPPTPAVEITDAMLQGAITAKNADARNTPKIKELIVSFTGDPVAKIYAVTDQMRRAQFLEQLKVL